MRLQDHDHRLGHWLKHPQGANIIIISVAKMILQGNFCTGGGHSAHHACTTPILDLINPSISLPFVYLLLEIAKCTYDLSRNVPNRQNASLVIS